MRAYDLAIFCILLSASFYVMEGMGIWPVSSVPDPITGVVHTGLSGNLYADLGIYTSIGILTGLILAASIVYLMGTRWTNPETVGIFAFTGVFWGAFSSTVGIFWSTGVPGPVIDVLGLVYFIVFMAAIIQMVTHAPMTGYQ